ncbi:hypothetical protein KAR91_53575 [Candidatus Pacearchaeota archaeon]|nr:hypothetical protein [Candidatus Pacearchaeota archaeon]
MEKEQATEAAYAFANAKLKLEYHVQVEPHIKDNMIMVNYNEMSKKFKYDPPRPKHGAGIVGYDSAGLLAIIIEETDNFYTVSRGEGNVSGPYNTYNFQPLTIYKELELFKKALELSCVEFAEKASCKWCPLDGTCDGSCDGESLIEHFTTQAQKELEATNGK